MTDFWMAALGWAAHSAGVGASVLLLGWVGVLCVRGASAKHLIGVWAIRAAVLAPVLCLLPAWLTLPAEWSGRCAPEVAVKPIVEVTLVEDPRPSAPQPVASIDSLRVELSPDPRPAVAAVSPRTMPPRGWDMIPTPNDVAVPDTQFTPTLPFAPEPVEPERGPSPPATEPSEPLLPSIAPLILGPAALVVFAKLARIALGYIGLWRLVRSASPVPARVQAVFDGLTAGTPSAPRLLISDRIATPVCFGLFRSTVLLPRSLAVAANSAELRWVFAHELDHVRRGDPVTSAWVGAAGALFFFVPWFWLLRRDLSLTQEYLADAAAAAADGRPVDYAAFLVNLSGGPAKIPFGANGVRAGKSDLFRRVNMLLNPSGRADRGWAAVATGGVLAVAVLLSGLGFASADDEKKTEKTEKKVIVVGKAGEKPATDKVEKTEKKVIVVEAGKAGDKAKTEKGEKKVIVVEAGKDGDKARTEKGEKKVVVVEAGKPVAGEREVIVIDDEKGEKKVIVIEAVKGDDKTKIEERVKAAQEKAKAAQEKAKADKAKDEAKGDKQAAVVEELKAKIAEAARKGNTDEMQALVEKLKQVLTTQKAVPPVKPVPPVPPLPPGIKRFDIEKIAGADQRMKEAIEKSMKALEEAMKNQPDNEQLKKVLDQVRKSMEEAMKHGHEFKLVFPDGAKDFKFAIPDGAKEFPGGAAWVARAPATGRLGVTAVPVPEAVAEQLELKSGTGLLIAAVVAGSAAEKAGLKKNDILVSFAGKDVNDVAKFAATVAEAKGGKLDAIVIRKGKKEVIKGIELAEVRKPETRSSSRPTEEPRGGKANFESMSVSVTNDDFTIEAKRGELAYVVSGDVVGGKPSPTKIVVIEGKKKTEYKTLADVPEAHRDAVKQLLGNVNRGGAK